MSDGTFGTFQGYPLRSLTYQRTRGYAASGAEMTLLASAFPAGFDFATPAPGELARAKTPELVSLARSGPAPLARRLSFEGFLVLSEEVSGQTWKLPPVRLFVTSVSTARADDTGHVALVRVVAVDERFFWESGWLKRWSFNRLRADGFSTVSEAVGAGR